VVQIQNSSSNQIMAFGNRTAETARLIPHSGIQFFTFGFNLETTPNFARSFIGHKYAEQVADDGTVPMELQPGWNEDDPDGDPPFEPQVEDDEYRVNKERAIETFLDRWIPIPFLAVRPGLDARGREILDSGPIDWARMRLSAAEPGAKLDGIAITHHVVIAFDTEILDRDQNLYVAPTSENVRNEHEFTLAWRFEDITRFLASSGGRQQEREKARVMSWVDRWIFEAFVSAREQQTRRPMREEEKKTVEHLARYVTLIQLVNSTISLPRIRLIDTYSDSRRTKPVSVDLVLDIGNSRTCGILVETYPNDSQMSFANTLVLGLRNLSEPHRVYRDPFESHVEFAQAHFGSERLSRQVRSKSGFFWPSPVRIGPEAARFREIAEGSEATSGMSSPKRYLCDLVPVNQQWSFQPDDYDADQTPPLVARRLYQFVNSRGDVKRQASEERQLYAMLAASIGLAGDGGAPSGLTFSRSSMFTFMLCEIIAQAWSAVNNPQFRKERRERDSPRELRRIFLSLPTAMPIQEQRIMRSRAHAAVKLMWDLMGWTSAPPPNLLPPEVRISLDEASCSQLVYLYNEIVDKFGGNVGEYFGLMGKPRPFSDLEQRSDTPAVSVDPDKSLRVASVDVGGGTTDLMITTYHVQGDRALVPVQNFREGFRIAGDDVLREVIQQSVLQPLEAYLRQAGIVSPREFLNDRFGGNKANMPIQQQYLRRQFVLRVLQPAGLGVIRAAEAADFESEERVETTSLGTLLGKSPDGGSVIPDRIRGYIEDEARRWGAAPFSLEACPIPLNTARVRAAVTAALGQVFDNIAEAINHFDCDAVVLSGRPTRMPATIDLFTDKLAISPDRLVPLSRYQVGTWYPFASRASFRIDDPKTATVVGCLLGVLVERQVTNFMVYTNRFNMRSTAKFIGQLGNDGRLRGDKVYFAWGDDDPKAAAAEEAKVPYFAPMRLGYRQLKIDRWTATPLYRLKLTGGSSKERIQLPVTVELARKPIEEIAGVEDQKLAEKEAQKEELQVRNAFGRDGGGGMKRLFALTLETLPSEDGYWLDTGILTVS
jgi:hypothetical protein